MVIWFIVSDRGVSVIQLKQPARPRWGQSWCVSDREVSVIQLKQPNFVRFSLCLYIVSDREVSVIQLKRTTSSATKNSWNSFRSRGLGHTIEAAIPVHSGTDALSFRSRGLGHTIEATQLQLAAIRSHSFRSRGLGHTIEASLCRGT